VDLIWSLGARYCVRQEAHAFMWLWALLLTLAGGGVALRARRANFGSAFLLFLALCTGAIGFGIFYGCYRYAPFSMGLYEPYLSTANSELFRCLGKDALGTAVNWILIVVLCSAVVGFAALARRSRSVATIVLCYAIAGLVLLAVMAAGFLLFFGFSWCMSNRLF
jgi:hypothetical protein